jgi:N-acetylmuramoyl-L-alanine amidase
MAYRILTAVLVALFLAGPVHASPAGDFQKGWKGFHALVKNERRAKYRSHWLDLKALFQRAYTESPRGAYAPKALYYLGRVYQELGKRSYLDADRLHAVDYFQRVATRFPKHSWADDALLKKGEVLLNQLKHREQAYLTFLRLVHDHPRGDMVPRARKYLRELDRAQRGGPDTVGGAARKKQEDRKRAALPPPEKNGQGAAVQKLQDIRHWSSSDYTRVVLDLEQEPHFSYMLLKPDPELNTPHRLVVDLSGTRLGPDVPREERVADGILRRVRTGKRSGTSSRVVLDIGHLRDYRVFSLPNPDRIVVDVYAREGQSLETAKQPRTASAAAPALKVTREHKKFTGSLIEQLGLKIRTVMLDPGHGGKDPGAVSNGRQEKDINLRMAKILGNMLEQKGYRVLYTRTGDTFVPLDERTAMANSRGADLFLSLHCNAYKKRSVSGLEIYYLNLATSKAAVRVAARENGVSVKKISDMQFILSDLMLNSKIKESKELANLVHNATLRSVRGKYRSARDHGVRGAFFYVLTGAKMPSLLAELGYLTNKTEAGRLGSDAYLKRIARGMVAGIESYKRQLEQYASLE